MKEQPAASDDLSSLRRQARLNELRLQIARQNEALAALRRAGGRDSLEGFYDDPSNFFDPRDYLIDVPRGLGGAIPSTRNDRDQGRDFPIFRTEQELAVIRGAARLLTSTSPIAAGILTTLTNYVIGPGFHYAVAPRAGMSLVGAGELAAIAGRAIDEFLDENDWLGDLDRELFQRSRVDGEYFLGLWHVGNGHVQARAVEPDQVTEPSNKLGLDEWLGRASAAGCAAASTRGAASPGGGWTFGVHTDDVDAQAVHGYYVQWTNRDTEWDYFPGGNEPILSPDGAGLWMEHAKLNVVRSVKRGLSDFYSIQGNLDLARRVLRNMGEGAAVQAAIAWIQETAPGTTQAQASSATLARADARYTTQTSQGSRQQTAQYYDPATILKVPSGQKYLPGPLGSQNASSFITAAEALLRTVAVRWSLPENLVTGTAENNNFASSLVAESPFVKFAESQQRFYARRDRRTLKRVLWFAWSAGRFGDVPWTLVDRALEISVTPPQVEVRDPEKETQVRAALHAAGILSKKTWSAQEGLDFAQEQQNLAAEATEAKSDRAIGGASGAVGTDSSHAQADSEPAESLEQEQKRAWDPSKHPRGGNPNNWGQFSKVAGPTRSAMDRAGPTNRAAEILRFAAAAKKKQDANRETSAKSANAHAPRRQRIFRSLDGVLDPGEALSRLGEIWIDPSNAENLARTLIGINKFLTLRPDELLSFGKGLATGIFRDGLWGSVEGAWDLGKFGTRAIIQSSLPAAMVYRWWYGEQPLAPEYDAAKKIVEQLAKLAPALKEFAVELIRGGADLLDAILNEDMDRLAHYSKLAQDVASFGGGLLADVAESLGDLDAETRGRILGFVLYQIAEGLATVGAGAALKSAKVCEVGRALTSSELLKAYPKVAAAIRKSVERLTHVLSLNICFVAGTLVHTPRGPRPIELIRPGEEVLARSDQGPYSPNLVARVTEAITTRPAELTRLTIAAPGGIETLRSTLTHPYFAIGRSEFVAACELLPGDRLLLSSNRTATVIGNASEPAARGECFTTYNLAVEGSHTYFVGQAGVWVHNTGRVCTRLESAYGKVLKKTGDKSKAIDAAVDELAKILRDPKADLKAIEEELAKSKVPGISPEELLEKARAKAASAAKHETPIVTRSTNKAIVKIAAQRGDELVAKKNWAGKFEEARKVAEKGRDIVPGLFKYRSRQSIEGYAQHHLWPQAMGGPKDGWVVYARQPHHRLTGIQDRLNSFLCTATGKTQRELETWARDNPQLLLPMLRQFYAKEKILFPY